MKILIIGANGLLGRNLVDKLSQDNFVHALVKNKKNLHFKVHKNVNLIEANLVDFKVEILPVDLDIIYYVAQSNYYRDFPSSVMDIFEVNVYAPLKIVEWARKKNIKKFIYTSSGGVYTNPNEPVKEFLEINANAKMGFYLNSKLSAEMLLKNYADFFETFVILRPFFMYGKGQNPTMLIPRLFHNIKLGHDVSLYGNEGIKMNPIFIDDSVKAIIRISSLVGEYIINIAGDEIVTIKELALLIGSIVHKAPQFTYSQNKSNDLIADNILMKKILDEPLTPLKLGLTYMEIDN